MMITSSIICAVVYGIQSTFIHITSFSEKFRNIHKLSKLNKFVEKFRFLKCFISNIFVNPGLTE